MNRRDFSVLVLSGVGGPTFGFADALAASGLSNRDAVSAIREALTRGVESAVSQLGKKDGFLGDPKVRIPLPGFLKKSASLLQLAGQGKSVDELVTAMNRAAELAVPEAKTLMLSAVKNMSVEDGRQILSGGEHSVTDFFAAKTREPLSVKFLPIVTRATEKVSLADKYNAVAGRAVSFGLVDKQDANVQQYVTGKALDGLYLMVAEEEMKIRKDPLSAGSEILKSVFGSLN